MPRLETISVPVQSCRAARAAQLVYGSDDSPGFRRCGTPGRFRYVDKRGRRLRSRTALERIRRLAIPPAWTEVWINPTARGHLQASGRDARGREQYLHHADWRAIRDRAKFDHRSAFPRRPENEKTGRLGSLPVPHHDRLVSCETKVR